MRVKLLNMDLKFIDYIFPTIQAIIACVALVGAGWNVLHWFKVRTVRHLLCCIGLLLLAVFLFVWLYKAYIVGFHY